MSRASTPAPRPRFTALVLAGSRGPEDPVASSRGLAHKCLVEAGGVAMLQRVVEALRASDCIGRIGVALGDVTVLAELPGIAALVEDGDVVPLSCTESPAATVVQAIDRLDDPFPLLVTTADHPLLTPEMVDYFCTEAVAGGGDVAVALAPASAVLDRYPGALRTFLGFRDERYSGCNLFALMRPQAARAATYWRRFESQRKRPWRLAKLFGVMSLALYLCRLLTLEAAMRRVSRQFGLAVKAVVMPFAEAAIDVDKPADLALVNDILRARDTAHGDAPASNPR
ncbi:MAG: nucleotidyltransferase family protein [Alphaproteobacteria bacterium]